MIHVHAMALDMAFYWALRLIRLYPGGSIPL